MDGWMTNKEPWEPTNKKTKVTTWKRRRQDYIAFLIMQPVRAQVYRSLTIAKPVQFFKSDKSASVSSLLHCSISIIA